MNKSRKGLFMASVTMTASMLLTACGGDAGTATNTPVPPAGTAAATSAATAAATTAATMGTEATATTGTGSTSGGSSVIKIAVDLPVGGSEGANGIPTRQGIQLAIDQANAAGGVTLGGTKYTFEMYFLDDVPPGATGHDPAQGSKNADAFIADADVMAMVGPFNSNVARAMMPKLNNAGLASISPSNTATDLTLKEFNENLAALRPSGKITYFRVCTTDNIQGPVGADYAYDKLGKRKAYILDDTEVYGKGIADQFEKEFTAKGGTVLKHQGVPKGTADFSSIMSTVAAAGPDIVYYGGTQSNGIPAARKAMKAASLNVPLMGGDGIVESGYTDAAGADAEGDYGTVAAVNANLLPEAKTFIDAYKAANAKDKWNGEPQAYSANGFEAAQIIIDAVKAAGKKRPRSGARRDCRDQGS